MAVESPPEEQRIQEYRGFTRGRRDIEKPAALILLLDTGLLQVYLIALRHRIHVYYVHEQSRNLIDRLFGGRIAPFITQFSERQDLSGDEIEELKRLIGRLHHDR